MSAILEYGRVESSPYGAMSVAIQSEHLPRRVLPIPDTVGDAARRLSHKPTTTFLQDIWLDNHEPRFNHRPGSGWNRHAGPPKSRYRSQVVRSHLSGRQNSRECGRGQPDSRCARYRALHTRITPSFLAHPSTLIEPTRFGGCRTSFAGN
jgi:hypothetical protein